MTTSLAILGLTSGLLLATLLLLYYRTRTRSARLAAESKAAHAIIEEMSQDHWMFLAATSRALTSSLDYKATLLKISLLPIPDIADTCRVFLLEDDATVTLAVSTTLERMEQAPNGVFPKMRLADFPLINDVIKTGERRQINYQSRTEIVIPLRSRGVTLGAIQFESHRIGFVYSKSHMRLGEQLATSASLALDNAKLYESAQKEIKARERIAALISHDLKNPLFAIKISAHMLLKNLLGAIENQDPAKLKRYAEMIQNSATQMETLIQDLLDVAKIRSGKFTIEKRAVGLQVLLQKFCEFARTLSSPKNINIELLAPDDDHEVLVDEAAIFRAFSNIVGNAIKFTPASGKIVIQADIVGTQVQFTVADSGPGISSEEQPFVFNDFWQAKSTAALGTGLGLTIAKGIVEAHSGRIWVDPSSTQGAVFCFSVEKGRLLKATTSDQGQMPYAISQPLFSSELERSAH